MLASVDGREESSELLAGDALWEMFEEPFQHGYALHLLRFRPDASTFILKII